ncbi:HypC/HybG/HupF family hydrogenase formation chaperone [bacterium CPR1]|nr:HypC/HybG/HupF family hydrogenase formation chaperone [bacterium CPR1]
MCLAIPGRILSLSADLATVEVSGVRREVNIALLPELKVGDWVLIHVGFALSRLNEEEARQTLSYLEQLGDLELPR